MPQLTLEYTRNLPQFDAAAVLPQLNRFLADSGHFQEVDIKSRAVGFDIFAIGTAPSARAFVLVKLAILSGRSLEVRQALSAGVLAVLRNACAWPDDVQVQLCVEILEMERESYGKVSVGAGAA